MSKESVYPKKTFKKVFYYKSSTNTFVEGGKERFGKQVDPSIIRFALQVSVVQIAAKFWP